MSTEEIDVTAKRDEILKRIKNDPFYYGFVTTGIDRILTLSNDHPDYFPIKAAISVITKYLTTTAGMLETADPVMWDKGLRELTLLQLSHLCAKCTRCNLAENRLSDRGAVFGEGKPAAELMVVGEGPGNHESRTGLPLVDTYALRASTCATKCRNFEECFVESEDRFRNVPSRQCEYTPEDISNSQLQSRITTKGSLYSAGEELNRILRRYKFTRRSYVQVLNLRNITKLQDPPHDLTATPNNLYITNAVRCRSCSVTPDGKIKNLPPTEPQINACRPWLDMTIKLVEPKAVLAVGSCALTALQGRTGSEWQITRDCAPDRPTEIIDIPNGRKAYVTLHPAYIMRQNEDAQDAHWSKIDRVIKEIATEILDRSAREMQSITQNKEA